MKDHIADTITDLSMRIIELRKTISILEVFGRDGILIEEMKRVETDEANKLAAARETEKERNYQACRNTVPTPQES